LSGRDAHRGFVALVDGAILATFLLIVVGGIVRVSDAGLGCGPAGSGLEGWPLCQGRLVPASQVHSVLEYSHRFLAAVVTLLLVAIAWQALRRHRGERALVLGAIVGLLFVVVQGLLGALTVEHGLPTVLVAVHLGVAMLLLALLIGLALIGRQGYPSRPGPPHLRAVARLASALLLAAIVTGGVVAGTEAHGTPGGGAGDGAHMACGEEFPSCNGSLLPIGQSEMVDIQLTHRIAMLLAAVAIASLALLLRRHHLDGLALAIAAALATQVWLGAMNVWAGKSLALVVAHLTVATVLWTLAVAAAVVTGSIATDRRRWHAGGP
jgi:heme A synthase